MGDLRHGAWRHHDDTCHDQTHAMIMTHGRHTWQAHMTVHARHLQRGASDSRKGVPAEVSDNDDDATILSRLRRRASA